MIDLPIQEVCEFLEELQVGRIRMDGSLPTPKISGQTFGIAPSMRCLEIRADLSACDRETLEARLRNGRPVAGPHAIDEVSVDGEKLNLDCSNSVDSDWIASSRIDPSGHLVLACFLIETKTFPSIAPAGMIEFRSADLNTTLFTSIAPYMEGVRIHQNLQGLLIEDSSEHLNMVVAILESGSISETPSAWNVWCRGHFVGGADLALAPFSLKGFESLVGSHSAMGHQRLLKALLNLDVLSFERFAQLNFEKSRFEVATRVTLNASCWRASQHGCMRHAAEGFYRRLFPNVRFVFQFEGHTHGV